MITKSIGIKMAVAGASAVSIIAFSDVAMNTGKQIINIYKAATTTAEIHQIDRILLLYTSSYPGTNINFKRFMKTKFYSTGKDATLDYWGNPYQFEDGGADENYKISSLGPDGIGGNSDDIFLERNGVETKVQTPKISLEIFQTLLKKAEIAQEKYAKEKLKEMHSNESQNGNSVTQDKKMEKELDRIKRELLENRQREGTSNVNTYRRKNNKKNIDTEDGSGVIIIKQKK